MYNLEANATGVTCVKQSRYTIYEVHCDTLVQYHNAHSTIHLIAMYKASLGTKLLALTKSRQGTIASL